MKAKTSCFLLRCFAVFLLLPVSLFCETQIEKAAKLEKQLAGASPREKLDTLLQIMQIQMMIKTRPEKVIQFGEEAVRIAGELKDSSAASYAKIYQAHARWFARDKDLALQTMREALVVFEKTGNKKGMIDAHYRLGLMYREGADFKQALQHFYQALEWSNQINDAERSISLLYQVGIINYNLKDLPKSLEYYQKALNLAKKIAHAEQIAMISNNIGVIHMERKEPALALEYFQQCLRFFEKIGDEHWVAIAHANCGAVFADLNQFDQAIFHTSKELDHARLIQDEAREADILVQLGILYKKKKDNAQALACTRQAMKLAEKKGRKLILVSCYYSYSQMLEEGGDFREALKYLWMYIKLREEIVNEENNREIARLQEEFDARDRQREIQLLEKNNQIEKMRRNALIAGILLLLVFLAFFGRRYIHLFAFWKKQKYIGAYRLLEPLGSGGMGNVFKAHPVRDRKKIVAVKLLKEELFRQEDQKKRFRRESEIIDQLDHPNILKILERGEIDGRLYIVMEYIAGITLEKKIEAEGALTLEACLHIMIRLADALALIHGHDIVHRDLKPANIMLTRRGDDENVVKLLDFGLSRLASHSHVTQTGLLVGTVNYLAPEQITGGEYTTATDVYALGIVCYEMLTGKKTFAGDSFTAITHRILNVPPPPLRQVRFDIPTQLADLIASMIDREPGKRPTAEKIRTSLGKI